LYNLHFLQSPFFTRDISLQSKILLTMLKQSSSSMFCNLSHWYSNIRFKSGWMEFNKTPVLFPGIECFWR
jgi:hypothetical protein